MLHDWSDKYCLKILKQLRDAATPDTKLVVLEMIMPYACHDTEEIAGGIASVVAIKAPNPLLANWGAVNELIYMLDMAVRFFINDPLWGANIITTDAKCVQFTRKDHPTI